MSLRKLARVAIGVALLIPFATCTDLTGPSGGRGVRVPIIPTFSPAATFARALYDAAGIQYDRVRVLIVRGETEVLKDTTVAFSPSSADLTLPLLITANPGEVVSATLEYRSADIVLYSGTQSVTTVAAGASPTTPPTPLVLVPVGPGATAATVEISPTGGTFPTSAPVPFTATAFTTDHTPIANAIFGWTIVDPTIATVSVTGVVQPTSKGGPAKVRATTLSGKFAEATITFVTPPASLAVQSGGGQSAQALDALPLPVVVKVLDANGVAVPGATVNFAVATGGGSVAVINGVSNASGLVSANWTLGAAVGAQSITATATALPNNPITINATATERPAKTLAFGQQPTRSLMNASITPAVTVKALDDKGNVVAGYTGAVTIALDVNPNSSTLGGTLSVNAVAGVATFANLTLNKAGDGNTLKATATGLTAVTSNAFGVDQVPSGLSLNAGGSQTATIRSTLAQIVVKVADANGVGVPGVTVTFAVATGGGSIVVNNGVTDASGLARATWTLGNTVGAQSITATSGTLTGSPLTITATGTALPAVALAFVQQPSAVITNAAITPAVTVRAIDADGNTVTGFTGAIALALETANGATLGGTTSVAAVAGVATFSNLSVNLAGSYKLNATSGSLTATLSSTFAVSTPPPTALAFLVQPSNVETGAAITPAVQVRVIDANGNTVTNVITSVAIAIDNPPGGASLTGGDAVNTVNGVATFANLRMTPDISGIKLRATATGLTAAVSNTFNVNPPASVARNWTGAVSTDWNVAGNWIPAGVPTADDSVRITTEPANQPVITTAASAMAILIDDDGSLVINRNAYDGLFGTARIYNRGTLRLVSAWLFAAAVENRGTMIVDSVGIVKSLVNVGLSSKVVVKGSGSNGAVLDIITSLTNEGTVELNDSDEEDTEIVVSDSIVNKVGATIDVQEGAGGGRFLFGALRNYGTISVASSSGLHIVPLAAVPSLNAGSINVTAGTLNMVFPDMATVFTNTGTIAMGTGTWSVTKGNLNLHTATGTVTGTDTFRASGAALDIDFSKFSLILEVDGLTRFAGGSLSVSSGTVKVSESQIAQPTTISGTGTLLVQGFDQTNFYGGVTINSGGKLKARSEVFVDTNFVIAAGGILDMAAMSYNQPFSVYNPFTNNGWIQMSSSGGAYPSILRVESGTKTITNGSGATIGAYGGDGGERRIEAVLNNQAGGTVYVEPDSYMRLYMGNVTHVNAGTITIGKLGTAGTGNETFYSFGVDDSELGATFNNSGTISVGLNRTLYIGSSDTFNNTSTGVVAGSGTIDATASLAVFSNSGKVRPGGKDTVGTMTYKGDFSIGTGTVDIDVANISSADLLAVTGTAAVGGLFNVVGAAGCCGTLTIVTASSVSGTATVSPTGFPNGWFIQQDATTVSIYPNLGAPPPGGPAKPPFIR